MTKFHVLCMLTMICIIISIVTNCLAGRKMKNEVHLDRDKIEKTRRQMLWNNILLAVCVILMFLFDVGE